MHSSSITQEQDLLFVSLESTFIDKGGQRSIAELNNKFRPTTVTQQQLLDHVKKGHPFTAHLVEFGVQRSAKTFKCSNYIGIDVDNTELKKFEGSNEAVKVKVEGDRYYSVDRMLQDPFVQKHAFAIYHTASSSPGHEKFRILFQLQDPIHDARRYTYLMRAMMRKFPMSDQMCKDPCRIWYGAKDKEQILIGGSAIQTDQIEDMVRAIENEENLPVFHRPIKIAAADRKDASGEFIQILKKIDPMVGSASSKKRGVSYEVLFPCVRGLINSGFSVEETEEIIVSVWPRAIGETKKIAAAQLSDQKRGYTIGSIFWLARQSDPDFAHTNFVVTKRYMEQARVPADEAISSIAEFYRTAGDRSEEMRGLVVDQLVEVYYGEFFLYGKTKAFVKSINNMAKLAISLFKDADLKPLITWRTSNFLSITEKLLKKGSELSASEDVLTAQKQYRDFITAGTTRFISDTSTFEGRKFFIDLNTRTTEPFDEFRIRALFRESGKYDEVVSQLVPASVQYNPYEAHTVYVNPRNDRLLCVNVYRPPYHSYPHNHRTEMDPSTMEIPEIYEWLLQEMTGHNEDSIQYCKDWMANSLGARNQTFLCLIGTFGAGKGLLASVMGALHHDADVSSVYPNFAIAKSSALSGNFNSIFANKTMVVLDELTVQRGNQEMENNLKCLSNDEISIEAKGQDQRTIRNFANIMITANNLDALPAITPQERRFSIVEINKQGLRERYSMEQLSDKRNQLLDPDNIAKLWKYLKFYHAIKNDMLRPYRGARAEEMRDAACNDWELTLVEYMREKGKTEFNPHLFHGKDANERKRWEISKVLDSLFPKWVGTDKMPGRRKINALAERFPDVLKVTRPDQHVYVIPVLPDEPAQKTSKKNRKSEQAPPPDPRPVVTDESTVVDWRAAEASIFGDDQSSSSEMRSSSSTVKGGSGSPPSNDHNTEGQSVANIRPIDTSDR